VSLDANHLIDAFDFFNLSIDFGCPKIEKKKQLTDFIMKFRFLKKKLKNKN